VVITAGQAGVDVGEGVYCKKVGRVLPPPPTLEGCRKFPAVVISLSLVEKWLFRSGVIFAACVVRHRSSVGPMSSPVRCDAIEACFNYCCHSCVKLTQVKIKQHDVSFPDHMVYTWYCSCRVMYMCVFTDFSWWSSYTWRRRILNLVAEYFPTRHRPHQSLQICKLQYT